jgi:hypothetical protein
LRDALAASATLSVEGLCQVVHIAVVSTSKQGLAANVVPVPTPSLQTAPELHPPAAAKEIQGKQPGLVLPPPPNPTPEAGHDLARQPSSTESFWRLALAHLASNMVTLLVSSLLLTLAGLVLLRKLRPYLDTLRRLDSASIATAVVSSGPEPSVPDQVPLDLPSGEKFDLGPTYAEEMRSREEAARQQEEALVQQIFEQNLVLLEQIGQLEASSG